MKKTSGKVVSLVLALALVVTSFSSTFAFASTKTVSGTLTDDPDQDEFYLVNGGSDDTLSVPNFETKIYTGDVPLETKDHEAVEDPQVSSISHVSGDRVVKWDISDDGVVTLSLRGASAEGDEVLAVLYKGTYTDEDDNDYTVKASTNITIHAVDLNSTVIGNGDVEDGNSPEIDDDFAVKTAAAVIDDDADETDSQTLSAYKAESNGDDALAHWVALKTAKEDSNAVPTDDDEVYYTLKSSNSDIGLANSGSREAVSATLSSAAATTTKPGLALSGATITIEDPTTSLTDPHVYVYTSNAEMPTGADDADIVTSGFAAPTTSGPVSVTAWDFDGTDTYTLVGTATAQYTAAVAAIDENNVVTARVADDASTGSVTFTAIATNYGKAQTGADALASTKNVTAKVKIAKTIKVDATNAANFKNLGKDHGKTYLYSANLANANPTGGPVHRIDVSGYEVNFVDSTAVDVVVGDNAAVTSVTGKVKSLAINDGNVSKVDLDAGNVTVNGAKAGDITTDAGDVTVKDEATTGAIDATDVTVNSGKTGAISADENVSITADEDDSVTSVGAVSGKTITIDSEDSAVTVDSIKASADEASITLTGDSITVKAIDFDYRDAELTFADFQGSIPAPKNATKDGAQLSTTDEDDKVTVNGDIDITSISLEDSSQVTFAGSVSVDDVSGSGVMVVGAGKLFVDDSVSGATLKLSDANLAVGQTVFTATEDAVDADDFTTYGFTLSKSTGSKDTFKIASLQFAGVQVNKTASSIANGYSETFTATAYPGGTSIPAGYTIGWDFDGNDDVFDVTTSGNTATVKVISYDTTFSSENKGTLTAKLLDADGDEDDDYTSADVDLTAIAVPEAKSDTTTDVSVAKGGSYTLKVTSTTAPVVTLGTGSVFAVAATHATGSNDYFYKLTATGDVGKATGVFLNGTKIFVASVKAPVANFTSDTTKDIKVTKGNSYTYKITSATTPSFGFGTGGVFTVSGITKSGNDYFFKITATGNANAATGVFVNNVKVNVATVG